ncbi:MAG: LysR family transcriptional regulator [Salinivirgaceae bacterium]|nr:LysR family transcriptional regulator [Salinivirgaceae bacterium]
MEARQLRYFVTTAETLSFSEAGRRLYLSQSALSQQIKALENELGTLLFVRTTHNVILTESGQHLLKYARVALQSFDECTARMNDMNGLHCGDLRIGLTASHESFIRETGIEFLRTYRDIRTSVCYSTIDNLMQKLRSHELDMVFSVMPSDNLDGIDYEYLLDYKLSAIMRTCHPLANSDKLSFDDLRSQRLVLPEGDVKEHNGLEHFIGINTGKLNIAATINDTNAILNLLQETDMISILTAQSIIARPFLKAVDIEELSSPIKSYVFFASDTYRKLAAEKLLQMFKEIAVPKAKMLLSL